MSKSLKINNRWNLKIDNSSISEKKDLIRYSNDLKDNFEFYENNKMINSKNDVYFNNISKTLINLSKLLFPHKLPNWTKVTL